VRPGRSHPSRGDSEPAFYRDPKAALDWLVHAFDFEVIMAIEGPEDAPHMSHYEMAVEGRGRIMIGRS
jgi:uncharacterized glyoxalase superfamily protein PhnB